MRKTTTLLMACAILVGLSTVATAQTKKKSVKKTTSTTTKATPAPEVKDDKTTMAAKAENSKPQTASVKEEKSKETVAKLNNKEEQVSAYKSALGVKLLWGIAITGKHFFKDKHAIEAIVKYRGYSRIGGEINLAVLYEYHNDIAAVEGLRWYAGGGIYAGYFSFKDEYDYYFSLASQYVNTNKFYMGIVGTLGVEYKIKNTPIAVSADWQPAIGIVKSYGSDGFSAENGGIGVKYTF